MTSSYLELLSEGTLVSFQTLDVLDRLIRQRRSRLTEHADAFL